jgi:ATP-binding cassette subfamily B protein
MSAVLPATRPKDARAPDSAGLRRWPLLRCLLMYRDMPRRFWLTMGLYAALNGALSWQQALLGRAVQDVTQGRAVLPLPGGGLDLRPALWWLGALAAVALLRFALQYAAALLGLVIQQELLATLRENILAQVQSLHLGYHWQHGAGELITRTTRDADKLRDALTSFWRQGVDSAFVVVAAMGFLFWVHPALGGVPLMLTLAAIVLLLRQGDALVGLDREVGQAYDQVNQDLAEGVNGVRVIKAFSLQADRVSRFGAQVQRFVALSDQAVRYAAVHIPLPQMLVGFGQVWVLGWGLWLVSQGQLQTGPLVSALLMVNLLVLRIEGIGRVIKIYADARSSAGRIWELLDAAPEIAPGSAPLPDGPLGLRLESVRVLPPGGGHAVLEDVSLHVEPGELVALVGATGSGKSTLASLLPRLADPVHGRVLIGHGPRPAGPVAAVAEGAGAGVDLARSQAAESWHWADLRALDPAALRRSVQVVPQENFLFSDSLADNLRMAAPGASDEQLYAALALAAADDFVQALPAGLATKLGDRGVTLSGGQRQRICLARALLAEPAVLVLDDATSALDPLTERRILDQLRRLRGNSGQAPAVLLIANRRSSLAQADRVLLLQDGRIVAQGTHEQLARDNPDYRALMGVDSHGH